MVGLDRETGACGSAGIEKARQAEYTTTAEAGPRATPFLGGYPADEQ